MFDLCTRKSLAAQALGNNNFFDCMDADPDLQQRFNQIFDEFRITGFSFKLILPDSNSQTQPTQIVTVFDRNSEIDPGASPDALQSRPTYRSMANPANHQIKRYYRTFGMQKAKGVAWSKSPDANKNWDYFG